MQGMTNLFFVVSLMERAADGALRLHRQGFFHNFAAQRNRIPKDSNMEYSFVILLNLDKDWK